MGKSKFKPPQSPSSITTAIRSVGSTICRWVAKSFALTVIGSLSVVLAISFSALIFKGQLADQLGKGATLMLIGGFVLGLGGAAASSIRGAVLGTQDAPAIIIALAAGAITAGWPKTANADLFSTIAMLLAVSTFTFGATLLLLGRLRLGALVRYLPYPVIGGFMAATGWFLFIGALGAMTESGSPHETFSKVLDGERWLTWAPGVAIGLLLLLFSRLTHSAAALPVVIAGGFCIFYASLAVSGNSIEWAGGEGLLLGPFPEVRSFDVMPTATVAKADWGAIAAQTPLILAAVAMGVVGMLLNLTGVELATGRGANVNRDLRRTGLVNMVSGGMSGGSGYIFIGLTLLARNLGVLERSACLAAGVFCGFTLFAGPSFIGALPLYVFGGITMYLGADLLYQWLWLERRRLPAIDFAIVFIILLVAGSIGFLEGIAAGLVVSVAVFLHSCVGAPVVRSSFSNGVSLITAKRPAMEMEVLEAYGSETRIYQLQGVLFFGTIYKLATLISDDIALADEPIRRVIIDFEHIQDLDTSAIQGMSKIAADCHRCDVDLWICGVGRLPGRRQTEILSHLSDEDSSVAYSSLEDALERAEELTLERYGAPGLNLAQSVEPLLAGEADINEFAEFLERRVIPGGKPLITQGDETNDIYFLRRGVLSEEREGARGERVRIDAHFAGAVVGEMALYTDGPHSAHVVAATESEVLRLTPENLERMEREVPRIAIRLHRLVAKQISKRVHRTNGLTKLLKT